MFYIIFNPHAGRGRAARLEPRLRAALQHADLPFELVHTGGPGDAWRLAQAAATRGGYTAIVAAGGDGTMNEVANGMRDAGLPLGLIPLGTGNDLVKMFGLRANQPEQAVARLRQATPRAIDLGVANGRVFLNGLGCGFDAQIAVETLRPTRLRGFAVYLVALLRALRHYRAPWMRVCVDDRELVAGRLLLASVGNGRCQGGGFWLTPQAQIDDGRLDVCTCAHMRIDEILRHVPRVLRGTHDRLRQVRMTHAQRVVIESAASVAVHLDGEILGTALRSVSIEIQPRALLVLA